VVGALMVALIATASLGGFSDIGKLSQSQRSEDQAATLAQQDQARLRGLTISQLASTGTGTGNSSTPIQVGGTDYTVTSASQFISGSTGAAACSGGAADEVQTTSTVTWGTNNGGRAPVVIHGLITPTEGGSLIAIIDTTNGLVAGATGAGAAGATISLSGPTAVTPVTVDSSGCAVFSGLAPGTYTISYTAPTGTWIVYPGGATSIPTQSATVTASQTTTAPTVYLAQPGAVSATFQTKIGTSTLTSASDTFVLANSQLTPSTLVVGTDSTKTNDSFQTTLTSPTTVIPFSTSMANSYLYTAYAGGCSADAPTGTNAPVGFSIAPNSTTNVTIPEPAMVIMPYTETVSNGSYTQDDAASSTVVYTGSGWTHTTGLTGPYNNTQSTSVTTANSVAVKLPLGATSATFYYTALKSYGIATISLSPAVSGAVTSVDEYTNSTTPAYKQSQLITSSLSPTTQYTMTITVSGTSSHTGTGYGKTISVDQVGGSTTTYGTPTLMTTAPDVTLTDTLCSSNEDWPPTQVPTSTNNGALLYPGVYDTTYTVCVDNGTNHYSQTVTAATLNTNFATNTGTTVNADIYPGAPAPPGGGSGYGTGVCT
jgi:hypothetical protein